MKIRLPRDVAVDPIAVRDGANPEIDSAIEAKVKELLEERLTAAVQEATAPLHNAIDRLSQNRDSILREKRELERGAVKEAEDREAARPKFVPLTREQARDPQVYKRAKDEAAKLGVEIRFVEQPRERLGEPPEVFATDTTYFVYAPKIKSDHTAYQRHKAEAARRGLKFKVAPVPQDFPTEAFESGAGG
jgi:hypothetical protein